MAVSFSGSFVFNVDDIPDTYSLLDVEVEEVIRGQSP